MSEFKLNLGIKAKDNITGFRGMVTARAEYLTGCRQYCVTPPAKDNECKASQWFDEDRLVVQAVPPPPPEPDNRGGPQAYPAPAK